jgi:hypothetical protein
VGLLRPSHPHNRLILWKEKPKINLLSETFPLPGRVACAGNKPRKKGRNPQRPGASMAAACMRPPARARARRNDPSRACVCRFPLTELSPTRQPQTPLVRPSARSQRTPRTYRTLGHQGPRRSASSSVPLAATGRKRLSRADRPSGGQESARIGSATGEESRLRSFALAWRSGPRAFLPHFRFSRGFQRVSGPPIARRPTRDSPTVLSCLLPCLASARCLA